MQYIKESLRKRILETALEEFDEKGYDGASMRAIAQQAGTSPGNLYRYFRSKDDLYASCLMPVLDQCIRWTGDIFDVSDQAISLTAASMARYVEQHHREFRIICQGPAGFYSLFLERFTGCIADRLRQHTGVCPAQSPDFFDTIALAFISGLRKIMENSSGEEKTAERILELMRFLFTNFDQRLKQLRQEDRP